MYIAYTMYMYVHVQCIYVPGGRSLASPTRALPMLGRLAWLGSLLAGPGYNTHMSHTDCKTQQQTIRIQMNTDHPLLDATSHILTCTCTCTLYIWYTHHVHIWCMTYNVHCTMYCTCTCIYNVHVPDHLGSSPAVC